MTEAGSGAAADGFIVLGRVLRPHGLDGSFLLALYTESQNPAARLLKGAGLEFISPDGSNRLPAEEFKGRPAARGFIAKIKAVTDRDAAARLKGWVLAAPRRALPPPPEDEVYWADLAGLEVLTREGRALGRVEGFMEAGAGLLLVTVDDGGRERLLPFQPCFLVELDLAGGRLIMDPPAGLTDL